jgi:hypothetical protein
MGPGLPDGLLKKLGKFSMALSRLENVSRPFGIVYRHSVFFKTTWYILFSFGTFFPVLVSRTKENLATLDGT